MALFVTLALSPLVLAALRRLRVLDVPSQRSSHMRPTPRGGGIAPALGALTALAVTPAMGPDARVALAVAAGALGVLGLVEDVVGVAPVPRLAIQVVAVTGSLPWLLAGLSGSAAWRGVVVLGAVVWLVAYANAFNFMDGIDGISVAQAAVGGTAWYLVGHGEGVGAIAVAGAIIAGSALGFAPFNFIRPKMFLGDIGSYFFGAWLATGAVLGLRAGLPPESVLAPLALYGADTGVTLARRVVARQPWYSPHREHTYQRLVRSGWSHLKTTLFVAVVIAVCSLLGAVSLHGTSAERILADAILAVVLVGYIQSPTLLGGRSSETATASP